MCVDNVYSVRLNSTGCRKGEGEVKKINNLKDLKVRYITNIRKDREI